jgi:nucleoid DNA-binding protein
MKEIFLEVAEELGISVKVVESVINTYLSFVRHRISKVPYKTLKSWDKVKTNFLLPGFGKLVVKSKTQKRLEVWKK